METLSERKKPLSRDAIKSIAMLTMLLNHIAHVFLPPGTWLYEIFISVGYFTAISMIYFLVEGYGYTRSKRKYLLRLIGFGLISEIPYCLAFTTGEILSFYGLNMMFTLALCFCLIGTMERAKSAAVRVTVSVLVLLASTICDWAVLAPVYTLLFLWARGSEKRKRIAFLVSTILFGFLSFLSGMGSLTIAAATGYAALNMAGMGLAGFCILFLYSGKQAAGGRAFSKWFFYAFYPAHLLILGVIRILLL